MFFILPNRPEKSSYLSKLQRVVALARAKEGLAPEPPQTVDKKAIMPAFYDVRIYFYALLYTTVLFPNIALLYFIPGILSEIGFVEIPGVALMLVPPLASSFVAMIAMAWTSDWMRDRGRLIGALCLTGALGYLLLLTVRLPGLRYFAVFLVAWGTLYVTFHIISNVVRPSRLLWSGFPEIVPTQDNDLADYRRLRDKAVVRSVDRDFSGKFPSHCNSVVIPAFRFSQLFFGLCALYRIFGFRCASCDRSSFLFSMGECEE